MSGHDGGSHHGHARDHVHGHDHGHGDDDHDEGPEVPLEDNPIWQQDNVLLHSVGVDIGSSGTQVAFSRLYMRRLSEDLTSRYVVVRRETYFESDVHLTPYTDDLHIDAALVVSERAGDLVCATAGHHMEAMLAAYGSGTVRASHERALRLLNVDIGGGTTKLTLMDSGRILATAALHIGGRLLAVDGGGRVVRLEPGGLRHARRAGVPIDPRGRVSPDALAAVAGHMAGELLHVLRGEPSDPGLWLTEPLPDIGRLDGLVFSGGVAEYVYGTEQRSFGDLGPGIGAALARADSRGRLPAPILPADARIRATVLGASEYTAQLSGITGHLGSPERTLPRRNLPVAHPHYVLGESVDAAAVGEEIRRHVARFGLAPDDDLALALRWEGPPEYHRVRALADAVVTGLADRIAAGATLYLVLDADIARTLGLLLRDELGITNDLVVLDGVLLRDFDYVDLGGVRRPSGTVAVTIKSLVFSGACDARADVRRGSDDRHHRACGSLR
jgi:ethanolamine utilization protein EutA